MNLRLLRRLSAFTVTALVVAAFGWVVGFVFDANKNNFFVFDELDFSGADTLSIEEFFNSGKPGTLALSENEVRVFLAELYYKDKERFADASTGNALYAAPRLPNLSIDGGELCIGVPVSLFIVVRSAIPEMVFHAELKNKEISVRYARLGNARIPSFIARNLFDRVLGDYKNVLTLNEFAAKLSLLDDVSVDDGKLVLIK